MTEFIRIYGSTTDTTPRGLVPARKSKDLNDDERFIDMCDIRGYFPQAAGLLVEFPVDNTVDWLALGPTKLRNRDVVIVDVNQLERHFIPEIDKKTLAYILNNCTFGRHPLPANFSYQFTDRYSHCRKPEVLKNMHKATKKPIAEINLIVWNEFDQSLQDFLNSKNQLLSKTHPMPYSMRVRDLDGEFDVMALIHAVLCEHINKLMSEDYGIYFKDNQHFGMPNLVLKINDHISLLIESRHIRNFECSQVQDLIYTFNNQAVTKSDANKSSAINQVLNYLVLNQVRYSILTNLDQSYVFERIEDDHGNITVRVSNVKHNHELLKVIIYLLHQSLLEMPIEAKNDPNEDQCGEQDQVNQDDDYKQIETTGLTTKPNKPKKLYKGHYTARDDALNNRKKFEQHVCEVFQEWDFELTKPTVVLGYGRTGFTTLGSAWNVFNPEDRTEVAVKMADYLKMEELLEEMKNEARIMVYANNRGLKCVPRLIWSGYFGFGGELYVNCTERVIGESRNLNKLNSKEKRMLREALEELRSANIMHCDIEDRNVLFGEEQCYIIDYGYARLYKKDTMKELEVDIDEASDSEVKSSSNTEEAITSQAPEASQ